MPERSTLRLRAFVATVSGCAPVSSKMRWPSASTSAEKPHSPRPDTSPTSMVESTVIFREWICAAGSPALAVGNAAPPPSFLSGPSFAVLAKGGNSPLKSPRTSSGPNKAERIFMVDGSYSGLERSAAYQFGVQATRQFPAISGYTNVQGWTDDTKL